MVTAEPAAHVEAEVGLVKVTGGRESKGMMLNEYVPPPLE
jgi:hypothetical protein